MAIQVQTPDGNIAEFPDGMSQDAIAAVLRKQYPAPAAPPPKPSTMVDVAKSAVSGLGQGAAFVAGLPGDVNDLLDAGANKVRSLFNSDAKPISTRTAISLPNSKQAGDVISAPTGGFYKPQTTAGRYAETIASFAPAALAPGGTAMRVARVVMPGAGAQFADDLAADAGASPTMRTVAKIGGAVIGGVAAGPTVRSINAVTSRLGAPIQNPRNAAQEMLGAAVRRDGGRQAVDTNLNNWRGNSAPAVIDVTGNNTRRLVRSAASGADGEAQNIATTYADRIAGNVQDNSLALTRRLTPGIDDSAQAYGQGLEAAQRAEAATNYRVPYSQPATVTREMVSALQGPEGRSAINRAYVAARANRDQRAMAELKDLLDVAGQQGGGRDMITGRVRSIEQALGEVSAGSLDRVRIAMRETGRSLSARNNNATARGYFGRVDDIDTALDQTPGLQEARTSYRNNARQQGALELGQTGMNASPESYAAQIAGYAEGNPAARTAAGVGYRQQLTDSISRPAEGATGVLNRISTSDAQRRNLSATYGETNATNYQTGIGNEIDRVRNARFISPNTGSQTALRLEESGLMDIPTTSVGLVAKAWDVIRRGGMLTPQERAELVRLGTTEARLVDLQRANPSLTSRTLTNVLIGNSTGNRQ